MSNIQQSTIENGLLRMMPEAAFAAIRPLLKMKSLRLDQVLVEPNQPTETVYFVATGMASMVASRSDDMIETGYIGSEGMSAEHLLLMTARTPARTFMQVAGSGYMMPAAPLLHLLDHNLETRQLFLRYAQTARLQLAYTALVNGRCTVYERLARTLLMVDDRVQGNDLPLTHDLLAIMLGVRRSSVTVAIQMLEGELAIKATRGMVHIRNRTLLESVAGEAYGIPEKEYERLIGISINSRCGSNGIAKSNGQEYVTGLVADIDRSAGHV